MKPGPRGTPKALKLLRGNPGKRKIKDELQPRSAIPTWPLHLGKSARREWRRVVKDLAPLGLITNLDRAALAAYSDSYGRWSDASDELQRYGMILKSPNGVPMQSPYLAIVNRAIEQMRSFLGEFGMTPSARQNVPANKPPEVDPFKEFLNSGKRI